MRNSTPRKAFDGTVDRWKLGEEPVLRSGEISRREISGDPRREYSQRIGAKRETYSVAIPRSVSTSETAWVIGACQRGGQRTEPVGPALAARGMGRSGGMITTLVLSPEQGTRILIFRPATGLMGGEFEVGNIHRIGHNTKFQLYIEFCYFNIF